MTFTLSLFSDLLESDNWEMVWTPWGVVGSTLFYTLELVSFILLEGGAFHNKKCNAWEQILSGEVFQVQIFCNYNNNLFWSLYLVHRSEYIKVFCASNIALWNTEQILPHSAPYWILSLAENLASSSFQDGATEWHYSLTGTTHPPTHPPPTAKLFL